MAAGGRQIVSDPLQYKIMFADAVFGLPLDIFERDFCPGFVSEADAGAEFSGHHGHPVVHSDHILKIWALGRYGNRF